MEGHFVDWARGEVLTAEVGTVGLAAYDYVGLALVFAVLVVANLVAKQQPLDVHHPGDRLRS